MAEEILSSSIPVPEGLLREVQKDISQILPKFAEMDQAQGVKFLKDIVDPLLQTANVVELSAPHRAAACNTICAIIEFCQTSGVKYIQKSLLDNGTWTRLFRIYLERSDNAKTKSMRQVFLVLTNLLARNQSPRSAQLRDESIYELLAIVCLSQDRAMAKPALQGLSHYLSKGIVTVPTLLDVYGRLPGLFVLSPSPYHVAQALLSRFLAWIAHNDTTLSASHLIRNYIQQARQSSLTTPVVTEGIETQAEVLPFWIEPVVQSLRSAIGKLQDYQAHVFPHCFKPAPREYLCFLSVLGCERHIGLRVPIAASTSPPIFRLGTTNEFRILLAAVQTGKELGMVKDTDYRDCTTIQLQGNTVLLPDILFGKLLSHPEPEARLASLSLLVHSATVTRPINQSTFRFLRQHLGHLHADTDANFRSELLSQFQRLFDRLRASTAGLAKSITPGAAKNRPPTSIHSILNTRLDPAQQESPQGSLRHHLGFITWYLRFLESELRPTASYQRHITALKSLLIVMRSGLDVDIPDACLAKQAQGELRWAYKISVLSPSLCRSLEDLMLDPFDDVRSAATSMLAFGLETNNSEVMSLIKSTYPRFLGRAEALMLRTGRADQADGLARGYSLLVSNPSKSGKQNGASPGDPQIFDYLLRQLEETVSIARRNLSVAVNGRPVHGLFASLRYIIDRPEFYRTIISLNEEDLQFWTKLHDRICSIFTEFWSCVQDVLCNDAPEGYLPEDLQEEASVTTKEVLSYSWRGLKEANLLLKVIVSSASIGSSKNAVLSIDHFRALGELCFTQLAELRHRGAFSTVSQTFSAFCRRCVTADDESLKRLRSKWYRDTLLCIQDKATSLTRRSAGIPSLMAGIIAADPDPSSVLFQQAMRELASIASLDAQDSNVQDSRLPQVHALNCLKDIFTTSRLSACSEAYVGQGLDLAAKNLNSNIWPIRNCGLMLFKALIERLFGSDETQDWKEWKDQQVIKTLRFSYSNYPNLIHIVSDILLGENEGDGAGTHLSADPESDKAPMTEGYFPALQILELATPPDPYRERILEGVTALAHNNHWHLRDKAARTYASLIGPREYVDVTKRLLGSTQESSNSRHGVLLCLKYTLKRFLQQQEPQPSELGTILQKLGRYSATVFASKQSPLIEAVFLDILNICGQHILKGNVSPFCIHVWRETVMSFDLDLTLVSATAPSDALFRNAAIETSILYHLTLPDMTNSGDPEAHTTWLQQTLMHLANSDPGTCRIMLELLFRSLAKAPSAVKSIARQTLLSGACRIITSNDKSAVRFTVQSALAAALEDKKAKSELFSKLSAGDIVSILDSLKYQCLYGPPSSMESAMLLLGYFTDALFEISGEQAEFTLEVFSYIRLLRQSGNEMNTFDTRFAAASSLRGLHHIWHAKTSLKPHSVMMLGFSLLLYDMLNDDDDEIRNLASPIAMKLIRARGSAAPVEQAVPIMARRYLVKFIAQTFKDSPHLCKDAIRRLVGSESSSLMFKGNVSAMLTERRKEDTALFIQEKQNLFKDDTLESVIWAGVLESLTPMALDPRLIDRFAVWVLDGLAVLKQTAQAQVDGAAGWTSKTEVFTLGLSVILSAGILLKWLPALGHDVSVHGWQIRKMLAELAEVGRETELHQLWMEQVAMILRDSIVAEMSRLQANMARFL